MKRLLFFSQFVIVCLIQYACQNSGQGSSAHLTLDSAIAAGHRIFDAKCTTCHNFKQDGIGPSLGNLQDNSTDWIKNFISDPKAMISKGDSHAIDLQHKFKTIMPTFSLTETELDQLVSFIHSVKGPAKEADDSLAISNPIPRKIPASKIEISLIPKFNIPYSSEKAPFTRISKMIKSPGNDWFINDQRGILYKIINNKPSVYLNIKNAKPNLIIEPGLATGFGSYTFDPHFNENGIFFTTHTEAAHTKKADFPIPDSIKTTLQWVVTEWKTTNPSSNFFEGTNRELLRVDMVTGMHGVQEITFNPTSGIKDTGLLYIGIGDGGSVENGYPFLTSHPQKIWGTIIRIDPRGRNSKNQQYGIPNQNPYAKTTGQDIVKEIYATGFRNPNHISWTNNGLMLTTNIGQAKIESLDIVEQGANYGWPIREGKFEIHPNGNINHIYKLPLNDSINHISYPVAEFDHDEGNAIAGGFEYRGQSIPALKGKYLFGDIPSGRLFFVKVADLRKGKEAQVYEWFVKFKGRAITLRNLCGSDRVDLRFATDDKGEIYLFSKADGKIYLLAQ